MIELKLIKNFPHEIIAVDEVGRGPLSGPVVIGAVKILIQTEAELKSLLKKLKLFGVNDSKKISVLNRARLLEKLLIQNLSFRDRGLLTLNQINLTYVTWEMDHEVIDQENILAASLRGMKEAAIFLSEATKISKTVLIDGHMKFRWGSEEQINWEEIPIIKGDSKSLLIGLASIIAKVKRDEFMQQMHELYPQYGFNKHAGYPTKSHKKAIETFGPSPIHRKSFKGVKEFAGP